MNTYLKWLHKLTALGYRKKVIIPTNIEPIVKGLYEKNIKPAEALDFLIRNHFEKLLSTAKY